ncbi:MAG: hypothetical protein R6U96_07085 [Promethearchaeia archaeon]
MKKTQKIEGCFLLDFRAKINDLERQLKEYKNNEDIYAEKLAKKDLL